jgi:Ca-activated chloride channel family protein
MSPFAHPHLLWLLAALPLAAALRWWWGGRARQANASIGATVAGLRRGGGARSAVRAGLLWSGMAVAIAALAGPRWGEAEQVRRASGADLLIAFDCSRSMLATDLFPDRLHLARRKALDLLQQSPDTRVALLPFAAVAALRCPLTGDHLAVATLLDDCDPDLFPAEAGLQGTAIGQAVRTGLDVLARESGAGQAILVISDGADPDHDAVREATAAAKKNGVPIYGLFIGDPERSVEVQIDGRPEKMTAERGTLDELAAGTGAITVNATIDDGDVTALAAHLADHLARRPWEERSRTVASERYQMPLIAALLLLAAGWLVPTARRLPAAALAILALALAPGLDAAEPWKELAPIVAQAKDDPAGARAALEQLLLAHPDSAAIHYDLGCLQLDGDPANAARHLEAATRSPQVDLAADAWHNLALARLKLGRLDEAFAAADQALKRRPDLAEFTRTRDELRRALLAREDAKRRAAEEEAKRLRLATTALPAAHLGEAYAATLAASGGTPPYRFSATGLPDGLHLAADGSVAGTPGKAGASVLAVTVDDGAKGAAKGAVALEVLPAPTIATAELPEAIVDLAYRAELQSVGLVDPHWSVAGLPPGLTASEGPGGALISGTPTTQGTSTVHVAAADQGHRVERDLTLVVGDGFAPAESRLPPATAFADYQHRLTVRGRAKGYRWSQAQPEHGVAIAADGAISGAPDQAGDLTLHATIAAEDGRTRAVEVVLPVNPPPVIEEESKLTLVRGQAVNRPLKVSGGTPPYRWSGRGAPAGLRVDADGALRGSPSQVGEADLVIACEDRWKAGSEVHVALTVEERKDPEPPKPDDKKQDQQKNPGEDQQDQQKQDQAQQDQQKQDQQKQDQQKQDQQKQGEQKQDQAQGSEPQPQPQGDRQDQDRQQQKQDQAKQDQGHGQDRPQQPKPGAGQKPDDQPQPGKPSEQPSAAEQAADRWIEALPKDDRAVLRQQLLDGVAAPPHGAEKPW